MGAPTAGKNCGQANGACGSIALFRLENRAPLSYTCSKLGAVGSTTLPEECGTSRWSPAPTAGANVLVYASGSDYTAPVSSVSPGGTGQGILGANMDGVQYVQTPAQKTA